MKTYSTKANAKRAAKTQGLDLNTISIYEQNGAWVIGQADLFDEAEAEFEALQNRQKELAVKAEVAKAELLEAFVPYNPQLLLPAPKKIEKATKSVIGNPVQMVWNIADSMWGARRKDIIAECVKQGVAYNTARTQYQAFYKVKSMEGK